MKRFTLLLLLLWAFSWGCNMEEQDRKRVFSQERSTEEWIRILAVRALEHMGPEAKTALPTLTGLSVEEDEHFEKAVQKALSAIRDGQA